MIAKGHQEKLIRLLNGESIPFSSLPESLRQTLFEEQQLTVSAHGTRQILRALDTDALRTFLSSHFEELRSWKEKTEIIGDMGSRAEQAASSGNSKLEKVRSCPGFMVNSYEPISVKIHGSEVTVYPAEGTMLFIADWQSFSIPTDVLVIGVENMENFRKVTRQKYLFENFGKVLFVSRYPQSSDLREWLKQIPNRYLHFGDFDLAGINIFITEFYCHLGKRSEFFVPKDIEERLANGSAERYNSQAQFIEKQIQDERLLPLYNMIQSYHRCYDQEGYII